MVSTLGCGPESTGSNLVGHLMNHFFLIAITILATLGSLFLILICCILFISSKFRQQRRNQIRCLTQHPAFEDCVRTMLKNNIFLYIHNVKNPDISELFLRKLSEAWTILSQREDFDDLHFKTGYGLEHSNLSKTVIDEFRAMQINDANKISEDS